MKRILWGFLILLIVLSPLAADEYKEGVTLRTEITGVSSYGDFGLGYFPVSTSFQFYRTDLRFFEDAKFRSKFYYYMTYGFSNANDGSREWDTGRPYWDITRYEQNQINSAAGYNKFSTGNVFRQYGQIELWFGQPFIENPIEGSEYRQLFEFRFGFNLRYTTTTESLTLGAGGTPTFVDIYGNPKGMFAIANEENPIIAYPWLNGDRKSLTNYLFARLYFYPYREVKESVQDGVYGYLTLEYGPSWLLNSSFPSGYVSSDFFRIDAYLEEKMVLFESRQENRWNWFSIYLGHSNTYNYTTGDVVPYFKVPSFYLTNRLTDRFWFHIMMPNFIASDCYSYFEIGMTNNLYWGNAVNATGYYQGLSYNGSFNFAFHLRLFGFIRFQYDCSYTFAQGLNASYPAWWQRATINIYVSV